MLIPQPKIEVIRSKATWRAKLLEEHYNHMMIYRVCSSKAGRQAGYRIDKKLPFEVNFPAGIDFVVRRYTFRKENLVYLKVKGITEEAKMYLTLASDASLLVKLKPAFVITLENFREMEAEIVKTLKREKS